MCVDTEAAAWKVPLPLGDKLVLVKLAFHRNHETGVCNPGVPLMAKDCGMDERSIRRIIARLVAASLVSKTCAPGKAAAYEFHLTPDSPVTPDRGVTLTRGSVTPDRRVRPPLTGESATPDYTVRITGLTGSELVGTGEEGNAPERASPRPPSAPEGSKLHREQAPESPRKAASPLARSSATPPAVVSARPSQGRSTNGLGAERGASQREGKGTRIPEDFALTDAMRAWARQNTPDVDVEFETAEFIDFWHTAPGAKGRKADWPRTWQVRMREMQRRVRRPQGTPMLSKTQQQVRNTVEAAAEVARDLFGPDWKPA